MYYIERIHERTNEGPTNEILLREENEKERATSKRTVAVSLFRILAACANKKFMKRRKKRKDHVSRSFVRKRMKKKTIENNRAVEANMFTFFEKKKQTKKRKMKHEHVQIIA